MRELLKSNNKIELKHLSSGGTEKFKIHSLIGQGGACVVYSATRNNRKGILKEFYPVDFNDSYNILKRNKRNQLVALGKAYAERFKIMCEEFTEGYDLLEKANFSTTRNSFSNYVPEYEIYLGTEENSTVYIWTKQSLGITFDKYIAEVWSNPASQTEFKLYNLLTIIRSIALGVCGMHIQGLMHRDIKPDNFLIAKDGLNHINPYQVSMFDVNSFCFGTSSKYIVGSEGYTAPEVKSGKARYYSDIYSLGAVIYSSVVDNSSHYKYDDYDNLENLIDNSRFLSHISDIYIKAQLLNILTKSLANHPKDRYHETEDFITDLDKAIVRLLPHTEAKKLTDSNQRLKIIEEQKPIDAIPIFQDLFYKQPVFNWFDNSDEINILVIGGGLYGQAFMDVALTTLHMKNKKLNITTVTDSPGYDKKLYLKSRPDLEHFYNIDGHPDKENSYGNINFIEGKFNSKSHDNDSLIKKIITLTNPCYVLVSLGDDTLNNTIAKSIVDTKINALVNFVWSKNEKRFTKGNPIYINKKIEYKNIHENLLRMAFNTHLTWCDSIDADITAIYKDFRKLYHFKSSIAFALSVPYKLYSLGLTLEDVENDLSKVCFCDDSKEQQTILKELSWIEHRRWVTDKITSGWKAPVNCDGEVDTKLCLQYNDNKSSKNKTHLCIVDSIYDFTPITDEWETGNTENLDPLDKISVEIYRHFKSASDEFKKTQYLNVCSQIEHIKNYITVQNTELLRLADEYEIAINSIVKDKNSVYSYKFKEINNTLQKEIEHSNIQNKNDIIHLLKEIYNSIQPTIFANKKIDYKLIDEELIRNMAYIIGNYPRPKLAAVFNADNSSSHSNEELFKNVVSSMIIIPKTLKYLYYYTADTKLSELLDALNGTLTFFQNKNMKHNTEFVFVFENTATEEIREKLDEISWVYKVKFTYYENTDNAIDVTNLFINECKHDYLIDGTSMPFSNAEKNTYYVSLIKQMKYFEYDIQKNKIVNTTCPYLNYLNTSKVKLTISDLFALNNTQYSFTNPDMSTFYEKIWEIYTGKTFGLQNVTLKDNLENWNSLSDKLNHFTKTNDLLVSLTYNDDLTGQVVHLEKIMPILCYDSCKAIINALSEHKLLHSGNINIINQDSFRINISYDNKFTEIAELFSKYTALSQKVIITTAQSLNETEVKIYCDSILVDSICLNESEYSLLKHLSDANFINDLQIIKQEETNNKTPLYYINFCYPCESIKSLLNVKDSILKIYTYYSLISNGSFDDVKANVIFDFCGRENKFDFILTKDNKSIFIKYKSGNNEEKDYYLKALTITEHYGINSKLLIISDEAEDNNNTESFDTATISQNIEDINSIVLKMLKKTDM